MTETTGVTITPEQYNAIQHLTRHLGSKRSIVETHRVILDHDGWITKDVADFALLNSISVADMKRGLDEGWNVRNEQPELKAFNESFEDSWGNIIALFKGVTDNTLSLRIRAGKTPAEGMLSNENIDQLIDLLQQAKNH